MFVRTKKQTGFVTRPSKNQEQDKTPTTKPKISGALGGWDDGPETPTQATTNYPSSNASDNQQYTNNQVGEAPVDNQPAPIDDLTIYTYEQLVQKSNLAYETKLVTDVIQPGGIRVKPNQSILAEFCRAAKTLEVPIIASLLISRLELDLPFASKAKVLYTMEYLANKIEKYQYYFGSYIDYIRQLPSPSDNTQQYQELLSAITNSIIGLQSAPKPTVEDTNLFDFNDPGYNVPQKKTTSSSGSEFSLVSDPKTSSSNPLSFINSANTKKQQKQQQPTAPKTGKTFVSPDQLKKMKQQQEQDVTNLTQDMNLLGISSPTQPAKTNNNITPASNDLDILGIGGSSQTNNKQAQQLQANKTNINPLTQLYNNSTTPVLETPAATVPSMHPVQTPVLNPLYMGVVPPVGMHAAGGMMGATYLAGGLTPQQQQQMMYQYQMNMAAMMQQQQQTQQQLNMFLGKSNPQ